MQVLWRRVCGQATIVDRCPVATQQSMAGCFPGSVSFCMCICVVAVHACAVCMHGHGVSMLPMHFFTLLTSHLLHVCQV